MTVSVNIPADKDITLDNHPSSTPSGSAINLSAGIFIVDSFWYALRTYIGFNLSSIPSNAVVSAVSFQSINAGQNGSPVIEVYTTSDFTEGTVVWSTKPALGSLVASGWVAGSWTAAGLVSAVQAAVGSRLTLALKRDNETSSDGHVSRSFPSREAATSTDRPYLAITYDQPVKQRLIIG